MLRLGGVASNSYLVGFPAIVEHFQLNIFKGRASTLIGSFTPTGMPWLMPLSVEK